MDPLQPAVLGPAVVEVVEDLDGLLHLGVEVCVLHRVGWPEARRQHSDAKVDAAQGRPALVQLVAMVLELFLQVRSQRQVVNHAFQLRGELRTALHLQLSNHALLRIFRSRGLVQETLRKLVPVDLGEQVLVAEKGEQLHHLQEQPFDLVVGEALAGLLEDPVAERRHQAGEGVLADVAVDEDFEGFFEGLLEQRVLRETLLHDALESVVQIEEGLDEGWIREHLGLRSHLLLLLHPLVHDLVAPVRDVLAEDRGDRVKTVVH
mmetsp:Transcript_13074/g.35720  ORF Transcript_13074/g.35720 Transcript_13074/m.35720 type:complete len:263 (-) Transcript_13074:1017-1805(-)